jgi:hypothetical protein
VFISCLQSARSFNISAALIFVNNTSKYRVKKLANPYEVQNVSAFYGKPRPVTVFKEDDMSLTTQTISSHTVFFVIKMND